MVSLSKKYVLISKINFYFVGLYFLQLLLVFIYFKNILLSKHVHNIELKLNISINDFSSKKNVLNFYSLGVVTVLIFFGYLIFITKY